MSLCIVHGPMGIWLGGDYGEVSNLMTELLRASIFGDRLLMPRNSCPEAGSECN